MYPRASELVSLQQECRRRIDLTNLKAGELAGVQSRIDELIGAGQFQEATDHVLELLGADLNQIELNKLLVRIVQARKDAEKQAEISQVASEADQMAEAEEWESAVGILDGGLVRFPGELRLQKRRQALHERWQMEQRRREVEAIITEVHDLSISTSLRAARERLMRGFDEFGRDPALVEALERVDESIEAARRDESIAKAVAAAAELRDEGKWKAALDVLDRTATREGRDTRIEDLRASMAKQRHARDAQVARAASDARQNIQSGRWEEAVLGLSTDLRDAPGESVLNDLMQEAQRGLARKRREETIARITSEAAQRAQAGDYSDAIRLLLHAVSQYPEDETLNAALSQTLFERDQRKTGVGEMQPEDRKSSRDIPKTTEMPESDERQDVPAQVDERTAADSVEAVSDLGPRASNLQDTPEGQQTQTVHEQVERLLRQADDMASQCRLDEALRLLASAGQLDPRNAVVLDRLVEIARQRDHIQEVVHQAEEQYAAGNVAGALSVLESAPDAEAGAVISLRARIEQDRVESERRKRAQELAEAVAAVQGLITNNQLESARSELARLCARFPEEPKLEELLNYVRTSIGAADAIRAISAIRAEAAGLLRDGRSVEARAVLERGLRSYPDEAVLTSLLNRVAEQRPKRWPTPAPETREEPAGRAPFPDRPPETEEADPTLSATKVILKPLPRKYYIGAAATLLTVALLAGVLVLTRSKPAVILSPDPTELSFDVAAGSVRPPRQRVRWSDESIPFLVYNKDSWIEWFHPEDAGVVTEIGIIPAGMPAGRYEGFVTIRPMSSDDRKVEGTTTIAVHLTIHEPVPQPGSNPGTAISESPPKPSPNPPLKAVKAQLEPVIESFTAEPRRIEPGQQVNLRWSVGNADTVTIDPGIGRVEPSGLRILYPTEWTYYRLIARGPGGSKEAAVEITVNSPGEVETPDLGHVTVYTYKSRNFEVGEGNGDKMNYRGIMLYFGQGADRRDYVAAMKWFRQAVAVGSSDGMFNIGWLYEHGEGVRKDKHYASLMYQRAAAAGNKDALSYLHHHPEILRVKQ
jgi:tetratricopeptide (TPR) repeat protein